mmetsp:Transcript_87746/g.183424  ORF Transcript_87746/g.183424 Transcript_87746/m.183424 type:complete len:292 (-) Transcript_87746:163-1038(-)|eukprot:CAMPEP_0206453352 /NCGR_PEP_ID=MMETSP0324_2-20121206/20491_1 /ASSEMBLY_ACC=CAM_ASM_000836 /TAXON_ID=2866 /ORGANISM="Crypthecodinium cohnii, Strain Seligo" /LENGTH=291 /DNA_ID=CAMNT_0053923619 /DNA_START=70 /DNA_END=945 /DNA_ORIENTATION=+
MAAECEANSAESSTPEAENASEQKEESIKVCDGLPLLKEAQEHKEKANACFGKKNYLEAVKNYEKALETLNRGDEFKMLAVERDEVNALKAVVWCNTALCRLRQSLYDRAIDAATECLKLDKENTKALHRRSQAYEKQGQLEEALQDSAKLKKLGDGHLTAKESEEEEKRRERLWESLQKENREIDEVAKAQAPYWKMRERFNGLVDKYDLGDGQFFLLVARWLVMDECFDVTVERARKHWKMEKDEVEFAVKWVKIGMETQAHTPEIKSIVAAARQAKMRQEKEEERSRK